MNSIVVILKDCLFSLPYKVFWGGYNKQNIQRSYIVVDEKAWIFLVKLLKHQRRLTAVHSCKYFVIMLKIHLCYDHSLAVCIGWLIIVEEHNEHHKKHLRKLFELFCLIILITGFIFSTFYSGFIFMTLKLLMPCMLP